MKGFSAVLWLMLVTLLLRSTALASLAARGVVLDVLAFAVVFWALRSGEFGGTLFGFVLGLAADLDSAHWLGRHALILSLLGYGIGRMSHTLVRNSARSQLVMLLLATAVHQAWSAAFEVGAWSGWLYVVQRVVLAALVTAPAGTLLLAFIRRVSGAPLFAYGNTGPGA